MTINDMKLMTRSKNDAKQNDKKYIKRSNNRTTSKNIRS